MFDAAHGAALEHSRAGAPRSISDRGGRRLRFGAAVAGRVERGFPAARRPRQQPLDLLGADQAGIHLERSSRLKPGFVVRRFLGS
jgi:hypothetical protein